MFLSRSRAATRLFAALACALLAFTPVFAGHNFNNNNSVGGISIDPAGVVAQTTNEFRQKLKDEREHAFKQVPAELNKPAELRMISLKQLEATCAGAMAKNLGVLPDEVKYLGGLMRVQYVFVVPEKNDIILAGPSEGWKLDEFGNAVGAKSGRPIIHIDDLLVALRFVKGAHKNGISCSIDPTAEGRKNFEAFMSKQKVFSPQVVDGIEKALGPQQVTITGVPANTHFARTLVAADFRMKRYAMNLEEAPVSGLASFIDMIAAKSTKLDNMMPRWWLAANYKPLAKSDDGLSWELRGPGVKALTEDEFVAADGAVKQTGKTSPIAKQWADAMTAKYDELSAKEITFGELRNIMDLCVVAAIIDKEDLIAKAGCSLPLLTNPKSDLMLDSWNPPKTISTQCSVLKKGKEYIITASGGVQVDCFDVIDHVENSAAVKEVRAKATAAAGDTWTWN